MMLEAFGSRYHEYMARTYRVIPLIFQDDAGSIQFRGFFATFARKPSCALSVHCAERAVKLVSIHPLALRRSICSSS